jgi:riboflavin synthase
MFSGIIADVGYISEANDRDGGLRLVIATGTLDLGDVRIGDSIAVNGVCLTAVKTGRKSFTVDVSRETLNCTEGLETIGAQVNLEKALRLADRLDGHLVSGHVDGVGVVTEFSDLGESWKLEIRAPQTLAKYIAIKGSITINGVSLTINRVADIESGECEFSVNLIPHTLAMTNLKNLHAGSRVNL